MSVAPAVVSRGTPDIFDAPVVLRFERHDRWHEMSDCQRYAVSEAGMGPTFRVPFRYDAWRRGEDGSKVPTNLGSFDTAEEARARCQAHLEGRYVVPKGEVWKP